MQERYYCIAVSQKTTSVTLIALFVCLQACYAVFLLWWQLKQTRKEGAFLHEVKDCLAMRDFSVICRLCEWFV